MGGRGAVSSSRRGINATSIGSWLQGRGDDGEKFNEENFMNSTIANFIPVSEPNRPPDYTSASGSTYWYENGGVIRGSDHWGKDIASCDWTLDGKGFSAYQDSYGFAKFSDFKLKGYAVERLVSERIDKVVSDKARASKKSNESMIDAYKRVRADMGLSSDSAWNGFKSSVAEKVKKRI